MDDRESGVENQIKLDEVVIEQLVDAVGHLTAMVRRVLETKPAPSGMEDELKSVRDSISKIIRVLHEDNGQQALITRVAVLEVQVSRLEKDLESLSNELSTHEAAEVEKAIHGDDRRWQIWIAVIGAIAALGAAIISIL